MLLYNQNHQQLSPDAVNSLALELENLDDVPVPALEELEADLENYYLEAEKSEKESYGLKIAELETLPSGKSIFERIREFICKFLAADSTVSDIIEKILEAISSIIPGGIIIKGIVKKLVKFIINRGYTALCPVMG